MHSQKPKQKLFQRLQQKTNLKLIAAGTCVIVLSAILLIYFNLTMVKEMKARNDVNTVQAERPVDLNVMQVKVDSSAARSTGTNYIVAKPLNENNSENQEAKQKYD